MEETDEITVSGGCHCAAVRYEARVKKDFEIVDCNCSICEKKGILHLIIPNSKFKLLSGEDKITTYTFQTHVAKHKFCSVCGIASFYIPRSHPDGVDINARCLDNWGELKKNRTITPFNGQNWEDNLSSIAGHK